MQAKSVLSPEFLKVPAGFATLRATQLRSAPTRVRLCVGTVAKRVCTILFQCQCIVLTATLGHTAASCTAARKIHNVAEDDPVVPPEDSWTNMLKADGEEDLEEFRKVGHGFRTLRELQLIFQAPNGILTSMP